MKRIVYLLDLTWTILVISLGIVLGAVRGLFLLILRRKDPSEEE